MGGARHVLDVETAHFVLRGRAGGPPVRTRAAALGLSNMAGNVPLVWGMALPFASFGATVSSAVDQEITYVSAEYPETG